MTNPYQTFSNTLRCSPSQHVVLQSNSNPAIQCIAYVEGHYFSSQSAAKQGGEWNTMLLQAWHEKFAGSAWASHDFHIHSVIF